MLSKTAQDVMGGEENEQMGVGENWVCSDVEKEYGGEEDEVLWPHRPEERYGEKVDAREGGRQAEKGQTCKDLVPGFERMDQAEHCCCITTGDRSGKMAINHQSHSSADSATSLEREDHMYGHHWYRSCFIAVWYARQITPNKTP